MKKDSFLWTDITLVVAYENKLFKLFDRLENDSNLYFLSPEWRSYLIFLFGDLLNLHIVSNQLNRLNKYFNTYQIYCELLQKTTSHTLKLATIAAHYDRKKGSIGGESLEQIYDAAYNRFTGKLLTPVQQKILKTPGMYCAIFDNVLAFKESKLTTFSRSSRPKQLLTSPLITTLNLLTFLREKILLFKLPISNDKLIGQYLGGRFFHGILNQFLTARLTYGCALPISITTILRLFFISLPVFFYFPTLTQKVSFNFFKTTPLKYLSWFFLLLMLMIFGIRTELEKIIPFIAWLTNLICLPFKRLCCYPINYIIFEFSILDLFQSDSFLWLLVFLLDYAQQFFQIALISIFSSFNSYVVPNDFLERDFSASLTFICIAGMLYHNFNFTLLILIFAAQATCCSFNIVFEYLINSIEKKILNLTETQKLQEQYISIREKLEKQAKVIKTEPICGIFQQIDAMHYRKKYISGINENTWSVTMTINARAHATITLEGWKNNKYFYSTYHLVVLEDEQTPKIEKIETISEEYELFTQQSEIITFTSSTKAKLEALLAGNKLDFNIETISRDQGNLLLQKIESDIELAEKIYIYTRSASKSIFDRSDKKAVNCASWAKHCLELIGVKIEDAPDNPDILRAEMIEACTFVKTNRSDSSSPQTKELTLASRMLTNLCASVPSSFWKLGLTLFPTANVYLPGYFKNQFNNRR